MRELRRGELAAGTVVLTGEAIAQLVFESAAVDVALLHEICFECPVTGTGGGGSEVRVRALAGSALAAQTVVRGTAGQVVVALLEAGGITAVEIDPGSAALVALCYLPTRHPEAASPGARH